MGPVTEWGPPPGLAFRRATISSIVVPGWILLCACIMVSTATVSPEFTTSLGGSLGSSQPLGVVPGVAGGPWYWPPEAATVRSRLDSPIACGATAYRPAVGAGPSAARPAT